VAYEIPEGYEPNGCYSIPAKGCSDFSLHKHTARNVTVPELLRGTDNELCKGKRKVVPVLN